jgi:hypothetical protein
VRYNWEGAPPFDTGREADSRRHSPRGPRPRPDPERGPLGWWYRLTMPPAPPATAPFAARERYRRSRMASVILFIFALIVLGSLPLGLQDLPTLYSLTAVSVVTFIALLFNRGNQVYVTGALLSGAMTLALLSVILAGRNGKIDVDYLQLYYLLIITELIAAALLPPATVFLLALVNSTITVTTLALLPAAPTLAGLLHSPDVGFFTLVFPAIAVHWAVAGVSFLLVRSATDAIRRADRAEEIAELQQREVERTRELEEGVRHLLEVHVRLANGDFSVRTQLIRNPLLWQIGTSLNNLIARLGRFAQVDFTLRRTAEEAQRLAAAVEAFVSGRGAAWPSPTRTPLDPVVEALRRGLGRYPPAAGLPPAAEPQPQGLQPPTGPWPAVPWGAPSQPMGDAALPDWLRPMMSAGDPANAASSAYSPPAPPLVSPPAPSDHDPWSFDPEANLPDRLRPPAEGGPDRGY